MRLEGVPVPIDHKNPEICAQLRVNRMLIGADLVRLYEDVVQKPLPEEMAALVDLMGAQAKEEE